jgi:hypothetical protein
MRVPPLSSWLLVSPVLVAMGSAGGCGSNGSDSGASEYNVKDGSAGASGGGGDATTDGNGFNFNPDGSSGGGSSGSSGASSGGGTSSSGGVTTTCIVGTQGCLCDTTGGCAPGLTCTPHGTSASLCCSGSSCTPGAGTSHIGAVCSATSGAASCKPGITIPAATGGNDSCGYPSTSFVESTTLCAISAVGGGTSPAMVQVFYNDEHALTLGCATTADPVSPLSTNPDNVHYPQTGDPTCVDTMGRPLRPVLYVTDISADPSCTAGDLQHGGPAYNPVAIFGTWKSAAEGDGGVGTPAMADPTANKWNLGPGADMRPDGGTLMPGAMTCGENYSAELRFEVGLISGHSYRLQVVVHDGDQNKGGDSGEACVIFCAGSGSSCPSGAQTCSDAEAGAQCPSGTSCIQGCCASADAGSPPTLPEGSVPVPP